jgi:hypothetical protein
MRQSAFSVTRPAAALAGAVGLLLAVSIGPASAATAVPRAGGTQPIPAVDPQFIYHQLDYMVTHFQHREAGYAEGAAGHSGFARYWTSEMRRLLGPFGATARRYPFRVRGWLGRPATAPAVNVEVTVPGVTQPAKVVVIGCHYDGEASSTQSANDDASGCAIELGVAEAMARFWRSRGLYPARTLRFVIFDAEEQGVLGSFDYVNHEANGTVPDIVAMFNEEQNGIGYPVRYLGRLANPLMPEHIYVSPPGPNHLYRTLHRPPAEAAANGAFASALRRAVPGAFAELRRLGYQDLTYRGSTGQQIWQPIFTSGQVSHVPMISDTVGASDQIPFTLAGIPDAMFLGNFTYYDRFAPAGSYPFDRPQDTIELMNAFADSGASQSQALTMALGLPGMLTTWMLSQPDVLGQARPDGRPIAAIGSIGQVRPHRPVALSATAFAPGIATAKLRYAWNFGDGTVATGQTVRHVYAAAGPRTLRLTVTAPGRGARTVSEVISVGRPATVTNPYTGSSTLPRVVLQGRPPANPGVALPVAIQGVTDKVGRVAVIHHQGRAKSSSTWWIVAAIVVVILAVVIAIMVRRRLRRHAAGAERAVR